MKNAPPGYDCPFCRLAETLPTSHPDGSVVLVDTDVFAFIPLHYFAGIKFHLHVFPRYSNDGLYAGPKSRYTTEERVELAARLRAALR